MGARLGEASAHLLVDKSFLLPFRIAVMHTSKSSAEKQGILEPEAANA